MLKPVELLFVRTAARYALLMKIVLTGGPSAGKTSVVNVLYQSDPGTFEVVQEAASVLFRGGFPRRLDREGLGCQQRAIYHVQAELEEVGRIEANGRSLVCDRGSLDGIAYWPDDEASFLRAIGSSMEKEIARYDWVLHLDTAAPADYKMSEIRSERSEEANRVNDRVKNAWRLHPKRIIIPNKINFLQKVDMTVQVVKMMLDEQSLERIETFLAAYGP